MRVGGLGWEVEGRPTSFSNFKTVPMDRDYLICLSLESHTSTLHAYPHTFAHAVPSASNTCDQVAVEPSLLLPERSETAGQEAPKPSFQEKFSSLIVHSSPQL